MRTCRHALLSTALAAGGAAPLPVVVPTRGCAPLVLPLRFVHGLPVTTVHLGGADADLLVDLGGAFAVTLNPQILGSVAHTMGGGSRRFSNARGDVLEARAFVLGRLGLSTLVLRDVPGLEQVHAPGFAPPVDTGTLGLPLLRQFRVTVDYGRAELTLTDPRCPAPEPAGEWSTAPLDADLDGVTVEVAVDGQARRLLLDTGATYSVMLPNAVPPTNVQVVDGQQMFAPRLVELGGARPDEIDFAVVDWPGPGVDGVLGCPFFAARTVQFDFERGVLSFRPSPPPKSHCPSPLAPGPQSDGHPDAG